MSNQEAIEKLIDKYAWMLQSTQARLVEAQERGAGDGRIQALNLLIEEHSATLQALEQMRDTLKALSEFQVTTRSMMLGSTEDLYLDTIKRMRRLAASALEGESE